MVRLIDCTARGALDSDLGGDGQSGGHELVPGRHLLHDPEAFGGGGADAAAGQGQQLGVPRSDLVGQAQVSPRVDRNPDLGLGQSEDGIVRGHPDVAHEGELEAEAQAVAVHRGDDRLGQVVEDPEALVHPPNALVVIADLLRRRPPGHPVLGHTEVDPGTEGPALGLDHEDTDAVVEAAAVGHDAELPGGLPRPHVELLGVVERERADAAAVRRRLEAHLPVLLGQHGFGANGHGSAPPLSLRSTGLLQEPSAKSRICSSRRREPGNRVVLPT